MWQGTWKLLHGVVVRVVQCMKVKSEREVAQSCLTLPELLGIIKNYSIINAKMDS